MLQMQANKLRQNITQENKKKHSIYIVIKAGHILRQVTFLRHFSAPYSLV